MTRKTVTENDWISGGLFGDIDEVINRLNDYKRVYPNAISLKIEDIWTGYEDVDYAIVVTRFETDEEMNRRIELKRQEEKRKQERIKEQEAKAVAAREAKIKSLEDELKELRNEKR